MICTWLGNKKTVAKKISTAKELEMAMITQNDFDEWLKERNENLTQGLDDLAGEWERDQQDEVWSSRAGFDRS